MNQQQFFFHFYLSYLSKCKFMTTISTVTFVRAEHFRILIFQIFILITNIVIFLTSQRLLEVSWDSITLTEHNISSHISLQKRFIWRLQPLSVWSRQSKTSHLGNGNFGWRWSFSCRLMNVSKLHCRLQGEDCDLPYSQFMWKNYSLERWDRTRERSR